MRKVFLFMMVSLDGYFEGQNHDLSWHNAANKEFTDFANRQLDETDTLLFGHATYEMMARFWPSDQAIKQVASTAKRMNELKKVVFSNSNLEVDWQNSEVSHDPKTYIESLKKQPGKDIAVLGSSNLSVSLIKAGLLDEIRVMVNPIVIGNGTPLFSGLDQSLKLDLRQVRQFKSGNTLLTYCYKNQE